MAVYPAPSGNPTIARWHVPDPLAEKFAPFSPYSYCLGNPVNFIDPDGREVVTFSGDAASRFFDNWINGKWGYSVDNLFEAIAESGGGGGSYMGGAYLGKEYNFTIVDAYGRYTLMAYLGDKPVFKLTDRGVSFLNSEKSSSTYVCSFEKVFTAANGGGGNDLLEAAGASAYWAGTINTLYGLNEEKNLAENLTRAKGYKQVTGRVPKSLRTSVNYGKATTALTKGVSKSLFGVGIVLSAVDVYQDPSASNIAWNSADVLMGAAAFIPGMQIPALIYFTARTAYEVYDAYNEP